MSIIRRIRQARLALHRRFGLLPTQKMMAELLRRGLRLGEVEAVELFGGVGNLHTLDYAHGIRSLEAWEIDPAKEATLRRNLPTAVIKITDSYAEVKTTPNRFNFVVVDTPITMHGPHFENFDLFPDVFRLARPDAILVINAVPAITAWQARKYRVSFTPEHLARRTAFYNTSTPERVSLAQMVSVYTQWAQQAGFTVEWSFTVKRTVVYYLILKLQRQS